MFNLSIKKNKSITRETVIKGFEQYLGRRPESEEVIVTHMTIRSERKLVRVLKSSAEYRLKQEHQQKSVFDAPFSQLFKKLFPEKNIKNTESVRFKDFLVPKSLRVESKKKGALLIGQCFLQTWINKDIFTPFSFTELILQNNLSFIPIPKKPIEDYDVQVISVPLRVLLPEQEYYHGVNKETINKICPRFNLLLDNLIILNKEHGLPTFVCNYIVPQRKLLGSVLLQDDNQIDVKDFLIQINAYIENRIKEYSNVYLLDIETLASSYGKRYLSEDAWAQTNHGSLLGNYGYEWDKDRIEKYKDWSVLYQSHKDEFIEGVWAEINNNLDIINLSNQVKIVIVDLDDTVWRGVVAEDTVIENSKLLEGWPRGFIESLLILKQRGIMLAIASNNDYQIISSLWDSIFRGILNLNDFVSVKINWDDKAIKVAEILNEVNLLANSVLFVDDNPRERERIRGAFPGIRTLDDPYFNWKRILLWSSVTQVSKITDESKRKTGMIQDKIQRDKAVLSSFDRESYLRDLQIKLKPIALTVNVDIYRAFELLNKTNQFNTAGIKISQVDFDKYLSRGCIYQFSCTDVYSNYGIISVVIFD